MNKNKNDFREQEAPGKNTDRAFVKVSRDGSPDLGVRDKKNGRDKKEEPKKPRK